MTNAQHRLFPFGLECAHCQRWHDLHAAIVHADRYHPDCSTCRLETALARSLLAEAQEALDQVVA